VELFIGMIIGVLWYMGSRDNDYREETNEELLKRLRKEYNLEDE
tara:strand:+ start:229 stop:360 length:132 start_codon:yes stop_codon:yes gene_type:complete